MEALVAVGFASNVVQFVDFIARLLSILNELRNNAALSEDRDHQVLTTHLETLAQRVSDSAKAISQTSATASQEEQALQPVADKCCELARRLLRKLDACGLQPSQNNSRTKRIKTAFKAVWNNKEIEDISNRLEHFKNELVLYYAFQTRKTQLDQQAQQPSKDDIQAILDKLDDIGSSINETRLSLDAKLNVQHSKLLSSVDEVRTENFQFHNQAAQQAASNQSTLLNKLDDLNMSMTSLNVGLQTVQTQQSSTFESLAQVRVENSSFHASITQQVPLASGSSSSLRIALRPLFEEYADKIVEGAKKEFRSAARSEMDNFLKNAIPMLDEMQYLNAEIERDHGDGVDQIGNETDQHELESQSSFEQHNPTFPDRQAPCQIDKNSITMLYRKLWLTETRLGVLSFIIRDRVRFSASGHPTRIYELTAQFNPSPRWFSTGLSITYEKRGDARGSPDFGLRPKAYRVLDDGHEVWDAIKRGDIDGIQCMLSKKLISTSDRNLDGRTLLHMLRDWGSICRLVDLDFNIPGKDGFLEMLLLTLSFWKANEIADELVGWTLLKKIVSFETAVQLRIGSDGSADTTDIPVAYAARHLYQVLLDARVQSLLTYEATPTLSIPYRFFYVHPVVANCLNFLEYVISKGITQRPDCIFDILCDVQVPNAYRVRFIWDDILRKHGFDVEWVYKECMRRKRVVTGETSAHEVSVGVDGSSIRDARRRRGYKNPGE
ncbi:hypothetical protein F4776DRAFT_656006 [Hypoxylon sp. NC0597]|nr:hypothetical protein F4776DRAFT_656006 [Hypoxylon sp. NC0597]